MDEKDKDRDLKLSKCPACGKAFYIRMKRKGEIQITCPYCEKEVSIKIDEERKDEEIRDES